MSIPKLAVSLILDKSRFVRRKCPKWLVPICISNPSLVLLSFLLATPALFTRMSMRSRSSNHINKGEHF